MNLAIRHDRNARFPWQINEMTVALFLLYLRREVE